MNKNLTVSYGLVVLNNLFLLTGLLFFGWSASTLMIAYWVEATVMSVFIFIQAILAKKEPSLALAKKTEQDGEPQKANTIIGIMVLGLLGFVFGLVLLYWIMLLLFLILSTNPELFEAENSYEALKEAFDLETFLSLVAFFVVSYLVSFLFWFFGRGRDSDSVKVLLKRFRNRHIVLHFTVYTYFVLFGWIFSGSDSQTIYLALMFIAVKTFYELSSAKENLKPSRD